MSGLGRIVQSSTISMGTGAGFRRQTHQDTHEHLPGRDEHSPTSPDGVLAPWLWWSKGVANQLGRERACPAFETREPDAANQRSKTLLILPERSIFKHSPQTMPLPSTQSKE